MTLSGIFRDLLPLQTRMLAEAPLKRHLLMKIQVLTISGQMHWSM